MQCVHAHVTMGQHTTPSPSLIKACSRKSHPHPRDLTYCSMRGSVSSLLLSGPWELCQSTSMTPASKVPWISQPKGRAGGHLWQHWDLKTAPGVQVDHCVFSQEGSFSSRPLQAKPLGFDGALGSSPGVSFWSWGPQPHSTRGGNPRICSGHLTYLRKVVNCLVISSPHLPAPDNTGLQERKREVGGGERAFDELCQSAPRASRPRGFGPLISSEDSGAGPPLHHVPPASALHFARLLNHKPLSPPNVHWASVGAQGTWRLWQSSLKVGHGLGRQSWSPRLLSVFWTKELSHCGSFFKKQKSIFICYKNSKIEQKMQSPMFWDPSAIIILYLLVVSSPLLSNVAP